MDSSQVTRRQARIVKGRLQSTLDYVTQLRGRMAKRGFVSGDELMDLVCDAEMALRKLCVDLLIRTEYGPAAPPVEHLPPAMEANSHRTFKLREKMREERRTR